jgi:hypothetical protein
MLTLDAFVLFLMYIIDIAAISIILINMGQLLMLLLDRILYVDSKKLTSIGVIHVIMKRFKVISDNDNNESKISSISLLANGLLFALEFECANAVLKLILVISSQFRGGPGPRNLQYYNIFRRNFWSS